MNSRNLLPPERRAAKLRQRATRRWAIINTVYAVLLAVAGGIYVYNTRTAPPPPTTDVARLNATLVSLRQQTVAVNANLHSVAEVVDRADWSILLALLADRLGDDVVLNSIDTSLPGAATTAATPKRFILIGVGRSLPAVTQYVLRVEGLHLFTQVRLTQTSPRPLRGIDAIGFQIVCTLPGGGQ